MQTRFGYIVKILFFCKYHVNFKIKDWIKYTFRRYLFRKEWNNFFL